MLTILRAVRNWPKKIISLHKTERKISALNNLMVSLKNENAEIRNSIAELNNKLLEKSLIDGDMNRKASKEKNYYRNIIHMGELLSINGKKSIFTLIKKYIDDIDNFQFFIDFALDYHTGSFSSHHYSLETFQQKIKQRSDAFLAELNADFLRPRELEITANHSIGRTFRFWSSNEKQNYIHFANYVIRILKELSQHVCFGYGAVLAAERTGQLIPHDDDMDIILYLPQKFDAGAAEAVRHVKHFLNKKRVRTDKVYPTHVQVLAPGERLLDVFVAIENGGLLDWIPGPEECLRFETVFPALSVELEGIFCDVPRDTENYLRALYGPDWRIPDHNFHHIWRTQG